jgi:transglutaminase-like putative cysteine protease
MPYYAIRHLTRYRYDAPVQENVTEVRMQPRSENGQRCLNFDLTVNPRAEVSSYRDHLGNTVHYFDIPAPHVQLTLTAEALVEIQPPLPLPETLSLEAWSALDRLTREAGHWDFLNPSRFAQPTVRLRDLASEFDLSRAFDPLTVVRMVAHKIYTGFAYVPQSTRVDSPIDEAIIARRGVCQDFTHIMIAMLRELNIPCRYISGYLFHREEDHDRSAEDATHAWIEAYLPELGWIGIDPTNDLIVGERHIRVAVGRDYADVPPTRGVFKGNAQDTLSVGVRVALADAPPEPDEVILPDTPWSPPLLDDAELQWQQQQQ